MTVETTIPMWEISAVWTWEMVQFFTSLTYHRQLSPKLSIIWEVGCCPRDKSTNHDKWSSYPVISIHRKWKWKGKTGLNWLLYGGDDEVAGCKKLRFHADSWDGISCVRNVIEVNDKVTAVTVAAQTFTCAKSRVSKTILPLPIYVPKVDHP